MSKLVISKITKLAQVWKHINASTFPWKNTESYHHNGRLPLQAALYLYMCAQFPYSGVSLVSSSPTLWIPSTIIAISCGYHFSGLLLHQIHQALVEKIFPPMPRLSTFIASTINCLLKVSLPSILN